jgi:hypothetical protein
MTVLPMVKLVVVFTRAEIAISRSAKQAAVIRSSWLRSRVEQRRLTMTRKRTVSAIAAASLAAGFGAGRLFVPVASYSIATPATLTASESALIDSYSPFKEWDTLQCRSELANVDGKIDRVAVCKYAINGLVESKTLTRDQLSIMDGITSVRLSGKSQLEQLDCGKQIGNVDGKEEVVAVCVALSSVESSVSDIPEGTLVKFGGGRS